MATLSVKTRHRHASARRAQRRRLAPTATVLLLLAAAGGGCAGIRAAIIPCPLTYSEQEKKVLDIAPKGIDRDEALRRLRAAGIDGDFGISNRVYYCDLWNRPDGERWHLNLALLFDESGKLYRTQAAQAEVAVMPDKPVNARDNPAKDSTFAPTSTPYVPGLQRRPDSSSRDARFEPTTTR